MMFRIQAALRGALAVLVIAVVSPITVAADDGVGAARSAVENLVERVLTELAKEGVEDEVKIKSLEKIVFEAFDFKTISRLVLARNFKKFSKQQRNDFQDQFKVYLSRSYGRRLLRYANEKVEIRDSRVEPRGDVTLMTVIVGGAANGIDMNYRMRNRDDRWRVIDVVIEGISLISNFRTQFKDIIGRDGPDGLLEKLRDKTFVLPDPEGGTES